MKITSKYTVALQLLLICNHYNEEKITSGFISRKIGADPVIIRQVMIDLKRENYIESKPGPGGTTLKKELSNISLYEIYNCVTDDDDDILKFYTLPSESTSFEKQLQSITITNFSQYILSFYEELKKHTLQELYDQICITL